jgi:hypothetical protein
LANFRTKKENSPNANLIAIDVFCCFAKKKVCPTDHHHHFSKDFGDQKGTETPTGER